MNRPILHVGGSLGPHVSDPLCSASPLTAGLNYRVEAELFVIELFGRLNKNSITVIQMSRHKKTYAEV